MIGTRIANAPLEKFNSNGFAFERPYTDNLCFQKIAQVPGDDKQYNHHFRMLAKADLNKEVISFMKMAYKLGS